LNLCCPDFTIIICDDGSTDGTQELIRYYSENESRIKYIKNMHAGVSQARNSGLMASTGDIIAYLDSDNEWNENYLLLMTNSLIENPNANTIYCGIRVMNNLAKKKYVRLTKFNRKSLLERNYIDLNIFMHRKHLYDTLQGFNETLPCLEDWDLILRYTKNNPPLILNCCLATYYFEKDFKHLTFSKDIIENFKKIKKMYKDK